MPTEEEISSVKRMIIEYSQREGKIVPIEEIERLASFEGIDSSKVAKAIDELISRGIATRLNESTIQVN